MAINKVDLTVTQLINDLNEGLTWLKKDDLGYGSIEIKYGANPNQIVAIRKHPLLKDAETTITIFNIIDDTKTFVKDDIVQETKPSVSTRTDFNVQQEVVPMVSTPTEMESLSSAADSFANL